ncbi:MAG TPA: hypothetical protein VFQ07_10710 [Candidatus Polarisedimenticolia bacterium]|nr:hypothetical protein [Candidatus Polarisedimenticolia bacterium]
MDWVVEHQADCEVVVARRALPGRPIGRLDHAPFRPPDPDDAALAEKTVEHLPAAATPDHLAPRPARQAAVLAILARAPLLVSGQEAFRDLIPLSSWSMNVPSAPADTLLVRTLTTAGDAVASAPPPAAELLDRLLAGDERRLVAMARERRREARNLGPDLFRRIAPRSAGLRGFAVSLDILPALAASVEARQWLAELPRERALALLGGAPAVFI